MNKEQIQGQFEQYKAAIKKTWGKLTDNEIMLYDGQQDEFFGKLKEHYGIIREDAEKQIEGFRDLFDSKNVKS
ncbi:MAG: CsbD family protein [Pseudobdellovibrionaceae bacterium]